MTISTYKSLYKLAERCQKSWRERMSVDWSEAEQLVAECRSIDLECLSSLNTIRDIILYADIYDEWDSGIVCAWPDQIRTDLETSDKQYTYRYRNDIWEVYGVSLSGEEDWCASVATEYLAIKLVDIISPAGPKLDRYQVMALSTAHLTAKDSYLLTQATSNKYENMVMGRDTGWFIKLYDELEPSLSLCQASQTLRRVVSWAHKSGYRMVEFDSGAEVLPQLPVYSW